MGVNRRVVVPVVDEDHIAKAVLYAGILDNAIPHATHWRAGGRRVIHPKVRTPTLQNGVKTHLEATGDARKLHRRSQEATSQALSVERVVATFGARRRICISARRGGILEPHRLVRLAVIDELRAQHPPAAHRLAIGFQGFIDHREAVALAQGAVKVDIARKNLRQLHCDGIRDPRVVGRREK